MRALTRSTLLLLTLVCAVAAYVLGRGLFSHLPSVSWSWVTLLVVAIIDGVLAVRIRAAVAEGRIGHDRSQIHPMQVARALALGQASAVLGSIAAGLGAGLALFYGLQMDFLAFAQQEFPHALGVASAGAALAGAGLYLESACTRPPSEEEPEAFASTT